MSYEVAVASSVFNMAGDEVDRPDFLKNLVIRNVLSGTKRGMGDTLTSGYLGGPGIKFRSFFRWAEDNYGAVGMPTGTVRAAAAFSAQSLAAYIPVGPDETVWLQEAWVGDSDFMVWAEDWVRRNRPDQINTEWAADMNNVTSMITIYFENNTTASFFPSNFVNGATYIFAYYNVVSGQVLGPVNTGPTVVLVPGNPFPSTAGWTAVSDVNTPHEEVLQTTTTIVKSYSDGRPNETEIIVEDGGVSYNSRERVYRKDTRTGGTGSSITSRRDIMHFIEEKVIVENTTSDTSSEVIGGVTVTTTTTVLIESLDDKRSHRTDWQNIIEQSWGPLTTFIYRLGTGRPELDALVTNRASYGRFFPLIPIRINGNTISNDYLPTIYAAAKKGYKKATDGGKFDDLRAEINNHPDRADMDFVYAIFGVSLNVTEMACRKYIYEFFIRLMGDQVGGPTVYNDYVNYQANYAAQMIAWIAWQASGGVGPEPVVPVRPSIDVNEIRINSSGSDLNYDVRLTWLYMAQTFVNGKGRPDAKQGDLWISYLGTDDFAQGMYDPNGNGGDFTGSAANYDKIRIYWQYENNRYKYIDAVGLVHRNYIYMGRYVQTTAREALANTKESGFIVPLHYGTFNAMSLVDSTQMSTASLFLVVNSYEARQKEWWESWWFQILIVIVVAIVSVTLTGGAGIGLLGSHLAVGGALGLTGMTAAIVGSVANALAALVLTTMLTYVAQGIFGEEIGMLIATILSIAIMNAAANFHATGTFGFNFSDLMNVENLMKLTNATVDAYTGLIRKDISDMQTQMETLQEKADAELKRIQQAFLNEFGYGGGQIDPLMFVANNPVMAESRDTFLTRTLLTGTDIANMSNNLLTDFSDLTLALPNAFT